MKLKQLFEITAIASALVLTGCKEDKKPEAAAAPLKIKVGVMSGPEHQVCLLYTSPSPRDGLLSRMPSSA